MSINEMTGITKPWVKMFKYFNAVTARLIRTKK